MTFQFEPATSYRTRGGFEAYVLRNQRRDDALYGYVFTPDGSRSVTVSVAPMLVCWRLDGGISPNKEGPYDLMDPGNLIEPAGPREIIDPEYDVARLGPKKVHENITDRLARIESRLRCFDDAGTNRALHGLATDVTKLGDRIAKSDEEAALNLAATDARLDRLSGIIDEQEERLKAMGDALAGTDHEGENVKRRLNKLENLPGLATLNAAVVRLQDDMETGRRGIIYRVERFEKATTDALANRGTVNVDLRQVHNRINRMKESVDFLEDWQRATQARADGADIQTPKRDNPATIGRWINVFKADSGDVVAGPVTFLSQWAADQAAKQDAGHRVACIQINEAFG